MANHTTTSTMNLNLEDGLENEPCAMAGEFFENDEVVVVQGHVKKKPVIDNCWNRFANKIRTLWATKQTEDFADDKAFYIKTTLRELIIYMIFIVLLVIITFGMRSGMMYYLSNQLTGLFTTIQFNDNSGNFMTMASGSDFWKYLFGPLLSGLYWTTWYNNNNISSNEINFIFYENKLLGLPRIRQVRMGNNSCITPIEFRTNLSTCYGAYSAGSESTDSFGQQTSTAWTYTPSNILNAGTFQGQINTYSGAGFYTDLANNQVDSMNILLSLFNNLWIDRGTRAVIVDFTVYNRNLNLFGVIRLTGEFPPAGGVVPASDFRIVKLIRYAQPFDFFVLSCEIFFAFFLLYYTIEEILEIKKNKMPYFENVYNVLDIVVIIISYICLIFNVYRTISVGNILNMLLMNNNQHANFDFLSYWQLQFDYLTAVLTFFATIKIFKYISFNKMMNQMTATISYCFNDLVGFTVMFMIIYFAFAQLGYLIFGTQLFNYRDLTVSVLSLFRMLINDASFKEFQVVNPILGPLFFIIYIFVVFFILFNMFLAIIEDAYGSMKEEHADDENEFEIAELIKEKTEAILTKLHLKREKILDIQKAMGKADTNNDGKMDFEEWKTELKQRGYADAEIEAVFARFDTDGDRVLDEQEQLVMQRVLEEQKISLDNELIEHHENMNSLLEHKKSTVSMDEYDVVCRRVDAVQTLMEKLISKVDIVLENFQNMDMIREKRKNAMEKIMNTLLSIDNYEDESNQKKIEEIINAEIKNLNQDSMSIYMADTSPKTNF